MVTHAEIGEQRDWLTPARPIAGKTSSWPWVLLLLISFLLLYGIVSPAEGGDTLRYAADAVEHAHGHAAQFWEFGHLLWRPWGYLGLKLLGPWFIQHYGDSQIQAVARFFVGTSFVCSLLTVFLIWGIARRFVGLPLATGIAIAFCGANGLLGFITLGSAYIPALCFECLSLWLLTKPVPAGVAGFSYALCVLLWFPFAFVGLGMLAAVLLWRPSKVSLPLSGVVKSNIRRAIVFVLVAIVVSAAGMAAGAAFHGAHSIDGIKQWILDADNGWSQHLNIVRAGTGIPRSLYELTNGSILLKRWFFHDPYNPVHLPQLAGGLLVKLMLFYTGMTALVLALLKRTGQFMLITLLSAAVPVLFFAVFIFEPGSTSRYVPLLPFLYAAFAIALRISVRRLWLFGTMAAVLVSIVLFNIASLSDNSIQTAQRIREQKRDLEAMMARPADVFVPTLRDPLYYVPLTHPLDHSLASEKYVVRDVIEVASIRLAHWRAEFAARTLRNWKNGREVWISQKLLASRPAAHETWVEGDDPRIHWKELPEYFRQFATDREEGGADGFRRLAPNPTNQMLLQQIIANDTEFKRKNL
jgi:hypothetical protein